MWAERRAAHPMVPASLVAFALLPGRTSLWRAPDRVVPEEAQA